MSTETPSKNEQNDVVAQLIEGERDPEAIREEPTGSRHPKVSGG